MAKHTDCQLDTQVDVSEMMGAEIYLYLEYKGNKMTARVAPTSRPATETPSALPSIPTRSICSRRDRADHPELNKIVYDHFLILLS